MFNIKWSGICAGAAFVVAFALSLLLGQTHLLIALLRAVIFAALFFGLGTAAWSLINTFLPELLSSPGSGGDIATHLFSTGTAGSRVNITVDDDPQQAAALPDQNSGAPDDVGDFNDLFTAKRDIDQIPATGYTEGEAEGLGSGGGLASVGEFGSEADEFGSGEGELGSTGDFTSAFGDVSFNGEDDEETSEFSMDFSAFVPGGLDDDSAEGSGSEPDPDMDAFSFFPDTAGGSTKFEESAAPERRVSRNKPMKLEGDFDAREIAAGLRTVLEKDKK